MDEFSAIANDLSVWEHGAPSHVSLNHDELHIAPLQAGFTRLRIELQQVAVLVCVMASAANALERGSDSLSLTSMIIDFCPRQTFETTAKSLEFAGLSAADRTLDELSAFQAQLSFAQMLTQHLDRKFRANVKREQHDIEILADSWRRVAANLLTVLSTLNALGQSSDLDGKIALALKLLKNSIAGGTPCLTADGHLEIPGWAERRSTTRLPVHQIARASTGGEYFEVAVLNASTAGLGLAGDIDNGQHTTVIFDDGRKVHGTVKWSEDGRFGLQLDQPLSEDDHIFSATAGPY